MTRWTAPALCPELELPALPEGLDLDGFRTANGAAIGADVPYWVVAWPGGQALARFLLDHPGTVVGRCVVDLGCGAGIVAAAAMRAGAARAVAVDSDPNALIAAAETARRNGVAITTHRADIERFIPEPGAIICAGDLWYERQIARRATSALRRLAEGGHQVLCGDPGRPDRPRQRAVERAHYSVPVSETFERHSPVECRVFELEALNIPPAHSYHASHAGARGGQ
ncbi:MAG: 50S ribosomal protein L11 methyltransferase [Pseudomonadota bacterium]